MLWVLCMQWAGVVAAVAHVVGAGGLRQVRCDGRVSGGHYWMRPTRHAKVGTSGFTSAMWATNLPSAAKSDSRVRLGGTWVLLPGDHGRVQAVKGGPGDASHAIPATPWEG